MNAFLLGYRQSTPSGSLLKLDGTHGQGVSCLTPAEDGSTLPEEIVLSDFTVQPKQKLCKVGNLLAKLSETERETVNTALAGPLELYPHTKIAEVLSNHVFPISDHTVRLHRTGACTCPK